MRWTRTDRDQQFGTWPLQLHVEIQCLGDGKDVFITASTHIHNNQMICGQGGGNFHHMRQGMAGLQRRDDAF